MGVYVIKLPDIGEGIAEAEIVAWHVKRRRHRRRGSGAGRRDDRQGDSRDALAGRRHGLAVGGAVGEILPVGSALIRIDDWQRSGRPRSRKRPSRPRSQPRRRPPPIAATAVAGRSTVAEAPATEGPVTARSSSRAGGLRADRRRLPSASGPRRSASTSPASRHRARRARHARRPRRPAIAVATDIGYHLRHARRRRSTRSRSSACAATSLSRCRSPRQRIPHFTYVEEVDVTELERLRAKLNEQQSDDTAAAHGAAVPHARCRRRRRETSRR